MSKTLNIAPNCTMSGLTAVNRNKKKEAPEKTGPEEEGHGI